MSASPSQVTERAAQLREAFDRAFAEPARLDRAAEQDLLAIRVGTQACALRLSDISGVFADRKITRVAGSSATLLGIAGFRGVIVPVYSLPALLDQTGSATLRWLVMAAAAPVALAFDAFEGRLRVAPDAILPQLSRAQMANFAREFVRTSTAVRPIIHLPSVLAALKT
jgi:purine-binding chemotaxis protein CheW